MPLLRPPSNDDPGNQSSKTPSGKKIPMAMSMMMESMLRMIQKATINDSNIEPIDPQGSVDEN